jgi:hypothetical protein
MEPLDAIWHLVNLLAPALGMGVISAAMAKGLWRRQLRPVALRRLALAGTAGAGVALLAGLLWFGRDGKMATYGAMIVCCAAGLWWAGWRPMRN